MPIISIILPTFNRLEFLQLCIDSVLSQSFSDWELIIADDGSLPETHDYLCKLTDPRISIIFLRHSGNPSVVRNAAISNACGKYLAFLDSDDFWLPEKLQTHLKLMQENPACRWSYGKPTRIDQHGNLIPSHGIQVWVPHEGNIVEELLKIEALIAAPTVIAERMLVEEIGGFDEQLLYCEDYDLWLRLAMRSNVTVLTTVLTYVRIHGEHYSQDKIGVYTGWSQLYAKMTKEVSTRRLRRLCRRRQAESAIILAALYWHDGKQLEAGQEMRIALAFGCLNLRVLNGIIKLLTKMVFGYR